MQAGGPSYPVELRRLNGLSSTAASVGGKLSCEHVGLTLEYVKRNQPQAAVEKLLKNRCLSKAYGEDIDTSSNMYMKYEWC
ncbi:hypothetical protein Tco_0185183 [Tanacetum coccineum]